VSRTHGKIACIHLKLQSQAINHGDKTWTGSLTKAGSNANDFGFMHYTNRLFAAGVNKLVFHGASVKFTDFANSPMIPLSPDWPGISIMAGMNYSNEWDDKTPMWEHVNVMTDYISRTQMVLQQGQGDVDLAYYRVFYTGVTNQAAPRDINKAGYSFDYVSPDMLNMDNAVVQEKDGGFVLAPDGPSYKALVIDQRRSGTVSEPFVMTLATAEKILGFAQAGLPVVFVGDMPSKLASYPGLDNHVGETAVLESDEIVLAQVMKQLEQLPSVIRVADTADLVTGLKKMVLNQMPSRIYG
jgi:hypothetical protein